MAYQIAMQAASKGRESLSDRPNAKTRWRLAQVKNLIIVCGILCGVAAFAEVCGCLASSASGDCVSIAQHRELLEKGFDTSRWKKLWDDDSWHMRCVFADVDGDGVDELLTASNSEEEDRTGCVWQFWRHMPDVGFRRFSSSGAISFMCHADSFYKMSGNGRPYSVVGVDMEAGYRHETDGHWKMTPDCKFEITREEKISLSELVPNVETVFLQKNVTRIERLYAEWYFGFSFTPPVKEKGSPYTMRMPYTLPRGNLSVGGGVRAPENFSRFADEYRDREKRRFGRVGDKVTVYAIFLDADNDGDADCFVASNAEKLEDEILSWTLYVQDDGCLRKANAPVASDPVSGRGRALRNEVRAGKMSFCRIVSYDKLPSFIVLDDATGQGLPKMVRGIVTDYCTHSIEKLACVEYSE